MQDLALVIAQLDGSRAGHHWLDPAETSQTLQSAILAMESIISDIVLKQQNAAERQMLLEQARILALRVKVGERLHQQSILLRHARYEELAEHAGVVCGSEYGPGSALPARFDAHRLLAEG